MSQSYNVREGNNIITATAAARRPLLYDQCKITKQEPAQPHIYIEQTRMATTANSEREHQFRMLLFFHDTGNDDISVLQLSHASSRGLSNLNPAASLSHDAALQTCSVRRTSRSCALARCDAPWLMPPPITPLAAYAAIEGASTITTTLHMTTNVTTLLWTA